MTLTPLAIPEVILIEPKVFKDERGLFKEAFKSSSFKQAGINEVFVQDNHSQSTKGVLRGLHYQNPPEAHAKLVSVIRGEVLDVAVDIRQGSPSYGKWVSAVLSETNHHSLYIPKGFAHGFHVLSEVADLYYKLSKEYAPQHDRGILWNDPELAIDWGANNPILSEKDKKQPSFKEADNLFVY